MQDLPHQPAAVAALVANPRYMLADDMGLGKTWIACRATQEVLASAPQGSVALVVCPAIAKLVWPKHLALLGIDHHVIDTSADVGRLPRKPVYIISLPLLRYKRQGTKNYRLLLATLKKLGLRLHILVLDEAHSIKDCSSTSCEVITEIAMQTPYYWPMSGTFIKNHYGEFYANARLVVPHRVMAEQGIHSLGNWENVFCDVSWDPTWVKKFDPRTRMVKPMLIKIKKINGSKNPELLRRILAPYLMRRTKKQVLKNLPELQWQPLEVENPLRNRYTEEDIRSAEEAAKLGKLPAKHIATARADLARALVPAAEAVIIDHIESDNSPILVFCSHLDPLHTLAATLPGNGYRTALIDGGTSQKERARIERAYQEGEIDCLLCQTLAGGVALTLTRGWRVLFIDLAWTPGDNAQARDRAHRIGQTEEVLAQYLDPSGNALAQRVNAILAQKTQEIAALLGN